ncbi:Cysteinyl-tRNA synthetase [Hordeum vulgare]|nr:Cysteinyl-tRNA synthetase [Hordeum vulgare]
MMRTHTDSSRKAAGMSVDSSESKEEEELQSEEEEGEQLPEPMEVVDPEENHAKRPPGLNMTEADAEFAVAQDVEMGEQQAIVESIQDEAEVEANQELIRQKHAEVDVLFNKLSTEIAVEEAEVEQPKGRSYKCRTWIRRRARR